MNTIEQASGFEKMPDFGMEAFGMSADFDINAAFQDAMIGVFSDSELALEEKVRRMEVIVTEGVSEVYRDFVDFRQMASQMEMMCSHDHILNQFIQSNETISGFMDSHKDDDGHGHDQKKDNDEYEIDPKTGKKTKKKKRRSWFGLYV